MVCGFYVYCRIFCALTYNNIRERMLVWIFCCIVWMRFNRNFSTSASANVLNKQQHCGGVWSVAAKCHWYKQDSKLTAFTHHHSESYIWLKLALVFMQSPTNVFISQEELPVWMFANIPSSVFPRFLVSVRLLILWLDGSLTLIKAHREQWSNMAAKQYILNYIDPDQDPAEISSVHSNVRVWVIVHLLISFLTYWLLD